MSDHTAGPTSTGAAGSQAPTPAPRLLLRNRAWLQGQYRSSVNLSARAALHIRFRTNHYSWQRWVFDHLRAPHTARVLEIGAGPGPLWVENHDRIPLGWRIWLTDLSEGMVDEAARGLRSAAVLGAIENGDRAVRYATDYAVSVADAQELPFADGSFDIVVANHMLYHVPDVEACMREVRRVLHRGGHFYAATNGSGHMRELHEFVRGFDPNFDSGHWGLGSFDIARGKELLPEYFDEVTFYPHANALRVTEPAPLAAYILSGILAGGDPDHEERLRQYVIARLHEDGPLHISTETGLFEATRH